MLAQSFLSAADLNIRDDFYEAAIRVLGILERAEVAWVPFHAIHQLPPPGEWFSMLPWNYEWECGTVRCIGGMIENVMEQTNGQVGPFTVDRIPASTALLRLFYPGEDKCVAGWNASVSQAAMALRNYLTIGEPKWQEVMQTS